MLKRLYYGPPNWLARRFSAEQRRAFAFWSIVVSAAGAIFWGGVVWYVTALSLLALVANFTSETPVEHEDRTL